MDTTAVRKQPDSQSLTAGRSSLSGEVLAGDLELTLPDGTGSASVLKLDQFRRELEELKEEITTAPEEQDSQLCAAELTLSHEMMTGKDAKILKMLNLSRQNRRMDAQMKKEENMTCRTKKLRRDIKRVAELRVRFDKFLKEEYVNPWAEKANKAKQEGLQLDAEIKRLEEESARLVERKQELLRRIELLTPYRDVMEQAAKKGGFESAEHLTDRIMCLIHVRDKLVQVENGKLDKINELKKHLVTTEDRHRCFMLQKHNQLAKLDTELEEARAEHLIWEKRWNHIMETETKKTLELGQIKMATLNIYEMTKDTSVNVNDTEKQLDKIKQFITDSNDIVKRYEAEQIQEQQRKEQKKGKAKNRKPLKRH